MRGTCISVVNSGLTPFHFSLFSSFFYSPAPKATTHTTTAAGHGPEPAMASTHSKNKPTMTFPSLSPVSPTATIVNAFKEENRGGDGPCDTSIKTATKEEDGLVIILTKDDDDTRCLKISTNGNDATMVENDAIEERYEHIGEAAVLRTTLT